MRGCSSEARAECAQPGIRTWVRVWVKVRVRVKVRVGRKASAVRYAQAGITRTTAVRAQALRGADEALRWLRRGEGAE